MLSLLKHNRFVSWIRKHKKLSLVILVVILLIAFVMRPKPPAPVETQTVKSGKITEALSATGTVEAENSVDLNFLTAGKVTYVGVKKGDTVKKGQTLATLDQRTVQKNLENALRDYDKQRNTFEQTKDDNNPSLSLPSQPTDVQRVLEDNQYDLEKAVASVELQDIAKENSVLTSPIDGIVTRADIPTAGVNAGLTSTFTVTDPDSLTFNIDVDEADIGKVTLGQTVKISLDAYPDQTIYAQVENIDFASHKTDTGGNAYTVQVHLPVGGQEYRQGMQGDAEIVLAQKSHALTVPLSALTDDTYVYVKTGKVFEKRKVKTGLQSDTDIEVISGLSEGDKVALQPDDAAKQVKK